MSDELDVEAAVARVLVECAPLPPERVDLLGARGHVLAADLRARWPLPGADVGTMDGWAVRAADLEPVSADISASPTALLTIAGESAAGHPLSTTLAAGTAARISTGAVLPPGADDVIAQEDTERRGDELRVELRRAGAVAPGHFVRRAGSDVAADDLLLTAGTPLSAGDLALACAAGHAALDVHRRPTVGVLCTGDELVAPGCTPGHGQVVSSNGLLLAALIHEAGAIPLDLGLVGDDPGALHDALARGLSRCDVLLTSGGISVGDHDLVYPALHALGLRPAFRRIRLRPGRPLTFGRIADTLVFALPGNPASTFVGFELFVRPALRKLAGHPRPRRPLRRVPLAAAADGAGKRAHYVRARLRDGRAEPLPNQASGALTSLRGCDALLAIPPGPGLPAGAEVDALVLRDPDAP